MTKMLLTIISCVFLCVACSDADYNNSYYEQQIDELYSRVIAAENEILNLQTQSEEINTVESNEATNTAEETNTNDIVISCSMDNTDATLIHINLYAQLDDVLKWNNISENPCKNASVSCVQNINVIAEVLDTEGTRRWCQPWNCIDNECTTMAIVYTSNCDADTIETITQFYSTTHSSCAYKFDELPK